MCSQADDPTTYDRVTPQPPAIHEVSGDREAPLTEAGKRAVKPYYNGGWPYSPDEVLAIERQARAIERKCQQPPAGTRLILASEDLFVLFGTRDAAGNRLSYEWGEPDEHGWYTPTVATHVDLVDAP
jgi:hypothetical protein